MWITTQFLTSSAGIGKVQAWSEFCSLSKCKLPPCRQHNSNEPSAIYLFVCLCLQKALPYRTSEQKHNTAFVLRPRSVSQSSVPFFFSSVSGFLFAVSLGIPEDSNLRLSATMKNWGSDQKETPGSASQGCVLTSGFVLHSWMITAKNLQCYRNRTISFWEIAGSIVRGRREQGTVIDSSWQ